MVTEQRRLDVLYTCLRCIYLVDIMVLHRYLAISEIPKACQQQIHKNRYASEVSLFLFVHYLCSIAYIYPRWNLI